MRAGSVVVVLSGVMLSSGLGRAQTGGLPPVATQDCTQLKGKAKKECVAKAAQKANTTSAAPSGADPFPFPEEQSKKGTAATADMPTGEPDPPASSMKPMKVPGADADLPAESDGSARDAGSSSSSSSSKSSSSSSSSSADGRPAPEADDAAPTTSGSDTPVRPGALKDLGGRADSSAARQKLEQTRVEDDLRIGRFYFKDGNFAGATARYQDALAHDADNPDAHFGMAEVLLKQNKQADAIAHLQRYLQLAPDDDHTKDAQRMLAKLRH